MTSDGGSSAVRVRASVLVPVVERASDLRELHRALAEAIAVVAADYEFLYLVSGEFRAELDIALELRQHDPRRIRVLQFAQPVSEATALAEGFERARGEILFTAPAYFDAEPASLIQLYRALENGADLTFACRTSRRNGPVKRIQTAVFNTLASWATGTRFRDLASSTRALRREVAREIPLYGDFHRFLPALAHRLGFRVEEVPVPEDPRARAPLVYRPRTYFWRFLDLLSIFFLSYFTRRPLRLFGAVGTAFGFAGAAILLIVGTQRILGIGEGLAGRPILILGTLLLGLGVQGFTIGLLGELLLFFHARELREYRVAAIYETEAATLPERDD